MDIKASFDELDRDELQRRLEHALEDQESSKTILTIGGGALALFGLSRLTPLGAVLALLGGGLVYLGQQNRSIADMGRQVRRYADEQGLTGGEGLGAIDVEKSITVNRPREEVYAFWRNFNNLARFMKHIESVEVIGDRRSRWRAQIFQGSPTVEWDAETLEDVPNERISWRSFPDSDVETFGTVRFDSVMGGRATEVRLTLEYRPPGGRPVAKLMNPIVANWVKEDLRRFKQMLESGEEAIAAGTPTGPTTGAPTPPRTRFEFE